MRNDWRARAVVALGFVLAAAGCKSTQPGSVGTRIASLRIVAKAEVSTFNCYQIWADDANGDPAFTGTVECDDVIGQQGLPIIANRSVPWNYSLSVSIIRAGSTSEEIAISRSGVFGSSIEPGDGIDDFISLTEYDPTDQPATVFRNPEFRQGYGIVTFENGRLVSRGSPIWLSPNGFEPGIPNILDIQTVPPTFDFDVNTGDTVIVRARKQLTAVSPHFFQASPPPRLVLSGTLSVGESLVSPTGTTSSTIDDGAGMTFSFAVR